MLTNGERAQEIWRCIGIPHKLNDAYLFNYISSSEEQKKAAEKCQEYIGNCMDRIKEGKGLFLYGPVGTGKTHLVVSTLREILNTHAESFGLDIRTDYFDINRTDWRGMRCQFYNVPELLENIKNNFGKQPRGDGYPFRDYVAEAKRTDFVIFDDMGAEKPTEWAQDQLYRLVDYRYSNEKSTMFTSNCSIKELEDRIGARTVSRIIDMTEGIKVIGPDYRKRKLGA